RYSTGGSPAPARPATPSWVAVVCGRITVIDVLRLSASEKKSHRRWATLSILARRDHSNSRPHTGRSPCALDDESVHQTDDLVAVPGAGGGAISACSNRCHGPQAMGEHEVSAWRCTA